MTRRILWTGSVFFGLLIATDSAPAQEATQSTVRIWEEALVIPTYEVGPPDRNPRFYAGRAYQGAQGRVYPYPMYDVLTDTRREETYNALYLENEYVKICVLPELGGRLFSAVDKTNGYDFVYRQHVIKPALIGMLGAWISGGIEWNLPHHHRATSMLPVTYALRENTDGSKTIWIGETELRHRMRWTIAITLRPGSSCVDADVTLLNRTPLANSFLHWANVSVHSNESYQVIFPPSTQFATYHAKREFAHWPISHEVYAGTDYTEGVDISWWGNHPEPISFFAWNYEDDFLAGYDHGRKAGLVHVADHHVVPGKKFWIWGPGPRGRMWDKILTDVDGPYLELMVGAYSDNQPDYSWTQPYEVKRVRHCWYPIRELSGLKNANHEAAVNLELITQNTALIAFNTTSPRSGTRVTVSSGNAAVFEEVADIAPDQPYREEVAVPAGVQERDLRVSLVSSEDEELIAYQSVTAEPGPMPEGVEPPPAPEDIKTVEELYLAGLRLEQFHHPSLEPDPYYAEALRRDPDDYRVNVALGIQCLRKGLFEEAENRFSIALKRATANYTHARDGEAYYYSGLALRFQGRYDAAYDAFYKAAWSHAFHAAAYCHLAELDCLRGDFATALEHVDRAIATNSWSNRLLNLKSAILRHKARFQEAQQASSAVLVGDPLDVWAAYELYLTCSALGMGKPVASQLATLSKKMRGDVQSYLELAVDYGNCGLWDEAIGVLSLAADSDEQCTRTFPLVHYYLGHYYDRKGEPETASRCRARAGEMPADYCFPFRLESIDVLRTACERNPDDARAPYYLGNLLYELQPESAIREWEKARGLDDAFPTAHRNLGIAYGQVQHDADKALRCLQRAVACDDQDPRLFYELDVLAEEASRPAEERLEVLRKHHTTIVGHNDAFSREIVLLAQLGHYDQAIEFLTTHHFRKWEGIGNIHSTYVDAHLLRGWERFEARRYEEAISDFEAALLYPENLEVAERHDGGRSCQVNYWIGIAYKALGDAESSRAYFKKAAHGKEAPSGRSELGYYRGLALRALGLEKEATGIFGELIDSGRQRLEEDEGMAFFAKFGEKTHREDRMAHAHYLMGLGHLGRGAREQARAEFVEALALNVNHVWARRYLTVVD